MGTSRGREIMRWRLSNAAGIHFSTKTRSEIEREIIKEELAVSILDMGDYVDVDSDYWANREPTIEELNEIEDDEDYVPECEWFEEEEYDFYGYNAPNYSQY